MIYLELLLGFLKVGCFTFGGAYSAIPLIRDVVLSYPCLSVLFMDTSYHTNLSRRSVHR